MREEPKLLVNTCYRTHVTSDEIFVSSLIYFLRGLEFYVLNVNYWLSLIVNQLCTLFGSIKNILEFLELE